MAHDGGGLVGLDGEGDAAQDPLDREGFEVGGRGLRDGGEVFGREALIGEPDVAELDAALPAGVLCSGLGAGVDAVWRNDFGLGVQELEDAFARGHGGLQDVVLFAQVLDGTEEAL